MCSVSLFGQIYPNEIQESTESYSLLISGSDNVYNHARLEVRNDSVCVVGDSCLFTVNTFQWLDFDTTGVSPDYLQGRLFYDTLTRSLTLYDDIEGTSLQIGQEHRIRVFNNNGSTITDGSAVSVTGIRPEGIMEVGLATAASAVSAINCIGIATHDIAVGEYGWVTNIGVINDVNTSAYNGGVAIFLSDSIPGTFTETRPLSPSYEVRLGGIISSHATEGKIYARLVTIENDHDNNSFFNGAILEPNKVEITSNGTTVNASLISLAANKKLSLIFDQDYVSVADSINIDLTLGTDTVPVENWVYITSAGTITVSVSGFPTSGQYTPIARVIVPSAATSQTYGVYKVHAYTDHLSGGTNGHLTDINTWIRKQNATWLSGVVLTQSEIEGTAADTIDLSYTSGNVSQLHDHSFPIYSTITRPAFVINDSDVAYAVCEGITSELDTDSEGNSIGNNKYYNLVVWGVVSEESKDCKLFFNVPSGSYSNISDALNDINEYTNYSINTDYRGTGFLITKLTIKRQTTQVTVEVGGTVDLRGSIPSVGGGSVIGGSGITLFDDLTDTPINKVGESLKILQVNAGETALEYIEPGLQAYSNVYNTTTKGYDLSFTEDNVLTTGFSLFYPTHNTIINSQPSVQINEVNNEPWESEAYVTHLFRYDNPIEVESIDAFTQRIRIGWLDGFGLTTTWHDSLDIITFDSTYVYEEIALDLDIDPTNEFQDLSTDGTNLNISDGTGVTLAALNYWVDDGTDLYYSNSQNVGINITNPTTELHVVGRLNVIDANANTFIGNGAGNETATGNGNLGFGSQPLFSLTDGVGNVGIGKNAGRGITTGDNNVVVGNESMYNGGGDYNIVFGNGAGYNIGGNGNVAMGRQTLDANTTGNYNHAIGYQAFSNHTGGSDNIGIGFRAGYNNLTGSSNIFIGSWTGYNETGSNKLYIDVSTTATPLIWGDFSTNDVTINGNIEITENAVVTGNLTVTDNLEGNAVNIAGWDSSNKATRVSVGTGLDLTTGTLSADVQNQSFASADMNTATIDDTYTGSTYYNISMGSVHYSINNVTANTSFEQMEIDETAYYNIIWQGSVQCDTGGTGVGILNVYIKISSTYTKIGTIQVIEEEDDQEFYMSKSLLLNSGDDIILSVQSISGQPDVGLFLTTWDIQKI